MSVNSYSKRRELKELLKVEIKNQVREWGPLSTLQGIVNGLINHVADHNKKVVNMKFNKKLGVARKEHSKATNDLIKFAQKLEKKYGSWEKVPNFFKDETTDQIPDIAQKLKDLKKV